MLDPALRHAESLLSTTFADVVCALPDEQNAAHRLNAALLHAGATPQVVPRDAQWRIVIAGPTPIAEALAALAVLVTVGGWRRLKRCARCGRPFVDRTNAVSRQRCPYHLRARTGEPCLTRRNSPTRR
jgi:predicted RNA-binding Zn ribbon-like protein